MRQGKKKRKMPDAPTQRQGRQPATRMQASRPDAPTWQEQPGAEADIALPAALARRFTSPRLIGRGSAGVVYAAHDADLGRTVALKALSQTAGGSEPRALAQQEARAVAALQHPNIVAIYDWIPGADVSWLVMEYVAGCSLAEIVENNGPLPPGEAVRLSSAVCSALDYAHQQEVWHLDIKPANIIVGADGTPKITDFGIARSAPGGAPRGWGTPGFAPPEQLAGKPVAQSDVYAAAALTWALLTGQAPPAERMAASPAWRRIPTALRPPLRAALSVHPEQRPDSPAALAAWFTKAWAAQHRRQRAILSRAWDAALVGAVAGAVAAISSGASSLALISRSTATWGALLLAAIAALRPSIALMGAIVAFGAALLWHMPTLGLALLAVAPLLVFWARFSPRTLAICGLFPVFYHFGFFAGPSLLAGALLTIPGAAWTGIAGTACAGAVGGIMAAPVVQDYLRFPPETATWWGVLSHLSPYDLIERILPAAWQGLTAMPALIGALLAGILAATAAWLRDNCEPPVVAGALAALLVVYELTTLALWGSFDSLRLLAGIVFALATILTAPEKAVETWDHLCARWHGGRDRRP